MKLGFANRETWIFLEPIHNYLSAKYDSEIFEAADWPLPFAKQKMSHRMLRRSLKQFIHRHDVVLFEWASELLVEASDLHTPSAAALVVRLHRYEMFKWVERIKWENVSYVILDTEAMRQKLLERTNVDPNRAIVLPNAVPVKDVRSGPRPFNGRIGILANLIPRKRIYELILGFYGALQQQPDLTLHIGGPPHSEFKAYHEALIDLCKKLDITDKVTFYGKVEDRWSWYNQMDFYISYSYSEGMQVAPIEAAACGCYCVSHWWEGADEVFPAEQLFVSEDQFVDIILKYCRADDTGRAEMREPTMKFVESMCDLDRINQQIETVLQRSFEEKYN
ncbi:MAG: glycosyltransferase family 4 protein [Chloroflexota bacterium]